MFFLKNIDVSSRDRLCTHLDHIVPLDSHKAYDMRDVIYAVGDLMLLDPQL